MGGTRCAPVTYVNASLVRCPLPAGPPGGGQAVNVLASQGGKSTGVLSNLVTFGSRPIVHACMTNFYSVRRTSVLSTCVCCLDRQSQTGGAP